MWECPDFFPLGDRHVLIYSTEHATFWEVGMFDELELRFHSESKGILDHGTYYAPRSMADGKWASNICGAGYKKPGRVREANAGRLVRLHLAAARADAER